MQKEHLAKLKEEYNRLKAKNDKDNRELAIIHGENKMLAEVIG